MDTNLYKIIYLPRWFYNFETCNWEDNKNQLNSGDILFRLGDIESSVISIWNLRLATTISLTSLAEKFWYQYYSYRSNNDKIRFVRNQLYCFLTKDNKKTIIWKKFLGEVNVNI